MTKRKTATASQPDPLSPLFGRLAALETVVADQQREVNQLKARWERHLSQGDLNIQMHCDTALALRQVSGALEDLVRRTSR